MFKVRLGHIHIALLMLMYSVSSLAATTQYGGIAQFNTNEGLVALTNNIFERDSYDNINASFRLLNSIDLDGEYNVPVGTVWTWQLFKKSDELDQPLNNPIGEYSVTYQGAVGDCPNMWSSGDCI